MFVLASPLAYAYRAAVISADSSDVKAAPSADAATQGFLPKGTRVNTSDQPNQGYYRVRSSTQSGWIRADDLQFSGPPPAGAPPPPAQRAQRSEPQRTGDEESSSQDSSKKSPWVLKALAGLDFFTPSAINSQIGSTALNDGTGLGAEVDVSISTNMYLAFRFEEISKSASGADTTGDQFTFKVSSTPVMVGAVYRVASGDDFTFDIGGYAGLGVSTEATGTDTTQPSPNQTTISGSAPTFLLAADLSWHITRPVWLFVEPGYRYLNLSAKTPGTSGNGSYIFESGTPAAFVPLSVNLSGLVLNFGVSINF